MPGPHNRTISGTLDKVLVAQPCPTLCDPMDCSPPGSSVHGILQARILEWVAMPSSRDLPDWGVEPVSHYVSWVGRQALYHWQGPNQKTGFRVSNPRDNRGWDGWMASLTRWTWVWVNFGIWWWTGRPGVVRFMGSQRVGHHWTTELNWTELNPRDQSWNSVLFEDLVKTCLVESHSVNSVTTWVEDELLC